MKKLLAALLWLCPVALLAQTGKVYDALTVKSKILNSERKYAVYLPPDYETSGREYPVLYLLHGAGDDQTGWVQFGEVPGITDKSIREGTATPMIIIMPDANTGRRGYFNDIKGDWNYEDFFFTELLPFVEKKYRIKNDKRFRAIAGLSMGGGGTFVYALHHPELFSSACPLSAATGFLNAEDARSAILKNNPNAADSAITNYYNRYSVIPLINAMPDANKKAMRWFMDIGDDDFLYEGNGLVHNLMRKKEIPHEYRVRDGAHNWTYWRGSLPLVLEFVSQAFHQY
ncbi:1,4-beta-xylanase [Mucilaginibacter sp. PAMC 26640]|nr:1,4-beta-xylanase [Mucilaginibacter sp. PAMC 26640]